MAKNRGPLLGWSLYNLMCEHYATDVQTVNKKPIRFHIYFDVKHHFIKKEHWMKNVRVLSFRWLNSLKIMKSLSNKHDIVIAYQTIYLKSKKEMDY